MGLVEGGLAFFLFQKIGHEGRGGTSGGWVWLAYMMKKRPAMPPTGTQRAMALGSLTVGLSTSSAIEVIMPSAENLGEALISHR